MLVEVDDSTENPLVADDGTPAAPRRLRHRPAVGDARRAAPGQPTRSSRCPAARLSALVNPSLTGLPAFLASGPPAARA